MKEDVLSGVFFYVTFYVILYGLVISTLSNKTINTSLSTMYDEYVLIFYCDNLHYCHNMNIMIDGTITLLLAYYIGINFDVNTVLTRLTCTFQYHLQNSSQQRKA